MNKARRIAEIPAGSWTKWLVVGLWAVVLIISFPLAGKLTDAEKNDAKAWLPANAESTKVLDVQASFQSPNVFPGVVVYERASGLTAADRAKPGSTDDLGVVTASQTQDALASRDDLAC